MNNQIKSIIPVFIFLVIGWSGCAPASTPVPAHTPTNLPVMSGDGVYRNEQYAFAFDYPNDVRIEVSEKPFEVLVSTDTANPFSISTTRDYLPGDVIYFLDTAPGEQQTLGGHTRQTYELPGGYCDGTACSSPVYALQMEAGQNLYKVVFYNQATMTPLQEQILSSFQVLP